jgi:hypothetical protein
MHVMDADLRSSCVLVKQKMKILWKMLHEYTIHKTSQNISRPNNIILEN